MRLLHIIRSMNPADGGIVSLVNQLMSLRRGEDGSRILTIDMADAPWLASNNFPVTALGPGRGLYGYAPKVVRWIKEHADEFDCTIAHGLWQFQTLAARQARRRLPYAVFPHGMLDPWIADAYPGKHAKKKLYWNLAERRVFRDASAVLYTAKEEMERAIGTFPNYPKGNDIVVGAGLDLPEGAGERERFAFLDRFPQLKNRSFLLYLSRLHSKKAPDLLIKAFECVFEHDDLFLVMAGEGESAYTKELKKAAPAHLQDRIIWTGHLDGDVKWGAYHAAEAFILPSHQENFCLAAVEALGCCLPVLISNRINIWREISGDKAGIVAEDTEQGTIQLLQQWKATPPAQRQQMRAAAFACYRDHFDLKAFESRLKDTLSDAIS